MKISAFTRILFFTWRADPVDRFASWILHDNHFFTTMAIPKPGYFDAFNLFQR